MFNCEFRLAGDNTLLGMKELDTLPEVGDEVEVDGQTYTVEEPARDPSSDAHAIWVRKTAER